MGFGRAFRLLWGLLDHVGRAVLLMQFGGAAVITALLGWALYAVTEMPAAVMALLMAGLFALAFGALQVVAPHILARVPEPNARAATRSDRVERSSSLQTVRLVRGEIDHGVRIVLSAIGVSQVYEMVDDSYWFAHRKELAAIEEAGDSYRLASIAWEGFAKYNNAVKGRRFISNDDLDAIAKNGERAVDALGVAADSLR